MDRFVSPVTKYFFFLDNTTDYDYKGKVMKKIKQQPCIIQSKAVH